MTENFNHYLKISFVKAEIGKHINFSKDKPQFPCLSFLIDAQFLTDQSRSIRKVQSIKLKETNRQEDYLFCMNSPKWDCFKIKPQHLNAKPQLKLKFSIHKLKSTPGSSSKNFFNRSPQKQSVEVKFPIDISPLPISIENFLKQPYKLHTMNVDFKLPKESKFWNQQEKKETGERDGMITFEFSFLQNLKAQMLIKNIRLKTQHFQKFYKVSLFEMFTNRVDIKSSKIAEVQRQLQKQKYTQKTYSFQTIDDFCSKRNIKRNLTNLQLIPHGWQQFRNDQSFKAPIIFSLQLLNEEDEVGMLFEFDFEDGGSDLNILKLFGVGLNLSKNTSYNKDKLTHVTVANLIRIEDLIAKRKQKKQSYQNKDKLIQATVDKLFGFEGWATKENEKKQSQNKDKLIRSTVAKFIGVQDLTAKKKAKKQSQNKDKLIHATIKDLIGFEGLAAKEKEKKQSQNKDKLVRATVANLIGVEDLAAEEKEKKQRQSSQFWTDWTLKIAEKSKQFDLEFQYMIRLTRNDSQSEHTQLKPQANPLLNSETKEVNIENFGLAFFANKEIFNKFDSSEK